MAKKTLYKGISAENAMTYINDNITELYESVSFTKRINILDSSAVITGYSTKSGLGLDFDGAKQANADNVLFYKVPVKPNTKYKVYTGFFSRFRQYNKTQLSILEFNASGVSIKYSPIAGGNLSPEITTDANTAYIHLSVNNTSTNVDYYKSIVLCEESFVPTRFYNYNELNINTWEDRLSTIEKSNLDANIKNNCKLIESVGDIYTLDTITSVVSNCSIANDLSTKKYASKAVRIVPIYSGDGYGRIKITLYKNILSWDSLTLVFYATDKTNADATIRIDLSADGVYSSTCGTHLNGRYEQGWNWLKITKQMTSNPDVASISAIYLTITSRSALTNGDVFGVMTLDSVIVNQRMKPIVLLSLDQLHQESFDNGAYQYALDRNIPFSLYCGNWQDIEPTWIDWCKKIEYQYNCELGVYGGYGVSNLVVADATDYKTAKDNLDLSYNKFTEIFGHVPVTYAAAQGKLTPINKPAIRDAGFKLARGGMSVYTGYLDSTFTSISQWGLGYEDSLSVIQGMIDNAITYGYCLNLFTHGIYDGATDPDYMHLSDWEGMIDYLVTKRDAGLIQLMTHEQFYNACVY